MTNALPNPKELDMILTTDGVEEYKRYDCRTYAKCLDAAADAGWSQFHCNDCRAYIPIPKSDPAHRVFAHAGRKLIKNGRNR
jgi:hypothetical protein